MRPPGTSAACSFARTSGSGNPDVQASMAASSSAARAVLPALSAREGSEARSSRPIAMSGQIAQAAHRLAGGAEPRPIAVGSGLSVSREANQHEAGIVARQLLVAETPLLQRPGTEILDDHVGTPRERANDLLPFLRF